MTEEEEEQVKQQLVPRIISNNIHEKTSSRMSSPGSSPSPPSSPRIRSIPLPRLYRLEGNSKVYILLLTLFSIMSIGIILDSFLHHQRDVSGCRESYMRPQYIKQTEFDSEMTRFAGKYSLYLYREKGVDLADQVRIVFERERERNGINLYVISQQACLSYLFLVMQVVLDKCVH